MKLIALLLGLALGILVVLHLNGTETGIAFVDQPVTTLLTSLGF
jgi:hypothetical protein